MTTFTTHFHAAPGQQAALTELLLEGQTRMRGATGCEFFELLHDENDHDAFAFSQQWATFDAHNTAFNERIVATGYLSKVVAALDTPIYQTEPAEQTGAPAMAAAPPLPRPGNTHAARWALLER